MVAREFVTEAATHHGRILVLDAECAKESTGHGSPMPQLRTVVRASGGGEEMGGLRGIGHYLQRTAIQDTPTPSRRSPGTSLAHRVPNRRSTPSAVTSKTRRSA